MDGEVKERETSLRQFFIYPTQLDDTSVGYLRIDADFWKVDAENNLTVFVGEPKDARRVAYCPHGTWRAIRER